MDWVELKNLARALVFPPGGPLLLACLGLALSLLTRRKVLGIALGAAGLAALWVLAMPVVSAQLMRIATPYEALDLRQAVSAQAIVVLAGGVRRFAPEYNEDAPNEITWQRLAYGARLARATGLPVLVTGGRGEAAVMRNFLVTDFGLPPRWVEEAALDTRQNASFARRLLEPEGIKRIVLVTTDWHMRRALTEFQSQGFDAIPAQVTDYSPPEGMVARWLPGAGALQDSRIVLNELVGIWVMRVRNYLSDDREEAGAAVEG